MEPGWLARQLDAVAADVATWPAWMRRAAGIEEPMHTDDAVTREWLVAEGWASDADLWEFTTDTPAGRASLKVNRMSDDPRIAWCLTIFAEEGWHMQGFVQSRETVRRLVGAMNGGPPKRADKPPRPPKPKGGRL